MTRDTKVKTNLISSLLLQLITVICGFILPRLILQVFGSTYNGLINSVNQFLQCVTLLRAGIGGVTRAALYRSLADGDGDKTSQIILATEGFMRKVARLFALMLVVFAAIYPVFVREEFDWFFSFTLVLVLGISVFCQYYFGVTYQMLLQADQKLYVYNLLQIAATILNTVLSVVLILAGLEIRLVKLGSAVVFGLTPIALFYYVRRNYAINRAVQPDNSTITQRWDAFAHQVAAFVHSNTDIIVLTIFTDLYQVSIYSVYNMVTTGIKQFVTAASNAMESMFGSIIAHREEALLQGRMTVYEWFLNTLSILLFGCTMLLIVPFVMVYTSGVYDTDYNRPLFGWLLCFAAFMSCVRLPYQNVVEAAGHFRQTRNGAIMEAVINILVSVVLVFRFGCTGVAIGTIAAMSFRTAQYAKYASAHILRRPFSIFLKRMGVSLLSLGAIMVSYKLLGVDALLLRADSYLTWVLAAIPVGCAVLLVTLLLEFLFYPKLTGQCVAVLFHRVRGKGVK
ncbi:MAG: polysaccharide biosynthesis C-terminal domain-containing protein [Oscillospiraceae bacterium]|nr:polysaccharide biosynthesis C-terminal domain-containing protein [Oscillospiraceae bacterium]